MFCLNIFFVSFSDKSYCLYELYNSVEIKYKLVVLGLCLFRLLVNRQVPYLLEKTPPAFILNLASLTRRLFEIRSLLEHFIHEAMDFLH